MTPVEAKLEDLAQTMGVTIFETSKLGSHLNACFHPLTKTVFVRMALDPATKICAIAHELGHVYYGHSCSSPRAEREADEWAARQLLTADLVEKASRDCDGYISAMAAELSVTPRLLMMWVEMYKFGKINEHFGCAMHI